MIFKLKYKPDNSVDRYKARVVAKSFHKKSGLEYGEIFSLVIKSTTVSIVCTLVVSKGWPIRQLDMNNTFFAGFSY